MDAIVKGRPPGSKLLLNIVAMLIVFVALVHLANAMLGLLPDSPARRSRCSACSAGHGAGVLADGRAWAQAATAGSLMGIKTILNELIAYVELSKLPAGALDPRSRLIMLYAMCGFANFGSLGIMIGGLPPWRRSAATTSSRSA